MSTTKVSSNMIDLTDNFAFTGTVTGAGGGKVVQVVNVMDSAVDSGTTLMISDDSVPTNSEGDEFMTLAITPTNSSNKLIILVVASLSHTGTNSDIITGLYQDTTAAALAAVDNRSISTANGQQPTNFTHYMAAGTTSSTTFKVRSGGVSGGTLTFNGQGAGRKLGGVCASSITIWEIEV
jgi:hypothetical protein